MLLAAGIGYGDIMNMPIATGFVMAKAYAKRRQRERLDFYVDVSLAVWGDKDGRRKHLKGLCDG